MKELSKKHIEQIKQFQKNEITEYHIYKKLAGTIKHEKNSELLEKIGEEELRHYKFWLSHTGEEVRPNRWEIFKFVWIARIFGITFGVKLMERGENQAQVNYDEFASIIPEAKKVKEDEERHENELTNLIEEERLEYVGSIILGLNDALVELTGALAGFTFAMQDTKLIALAGLITGIAASFSMAASEYLSTKAEETGEKALKSSLYTGAAYLITVIVLILPYLVFTNYFFCLALTLSFAIIIILFFTFYISVAKDLSFKRRFFEMAGLSLGVAILSFGIGFLIRVTLGVEV
jgi:VIT1/CCC1 family predicted Fe2+/Mn2+ transporter